MSLLSTIGRFCLNIICPPVCAICRKEIETAHCLCPECFGQLQFITRPYCQICGRPFEYNAFGDLLCGRCMEKKPPFDMARSVLAYDAFSKQLVLAFKHGDHTELTPLFGKFLLSADPALFTGTDMILAVPLHRFRLMKRKYNQAGLLCRKLASHTGIPYFPDILKRVKATKSQGHLSRRKRQENLRNAFRVNAPAKVAGKVVLLIDDVMTTGTTVSGCAKALKKAGAKSVKVLTLYRVVSF